MVCCSILLIKLYLIRRSSQIPMGHRCHISLYRCAWSTCHDSGMYCISTWYNYWQPLSSQRQDISLSLGNCNLSCTKWSKQCAWDVTWAHPFHLILAWQRTMSWLHSLLRMKKKSEMRGMNVVRVRLFFSFEYKDIYYPCALMDWFKRVGCDPISGLWVVHLDIMHSRQELPLEFEKLDKEEKAGEWSEECKLSVLDRYCFLFSTWALLAILRTLACTL